MVHRVALMLWMLLPAGVATAESCEDHFAGHQIPVLVNPLLVPETRQLCFDAYSVLHSGITRTPLWSAEHLTRQSVEAAKGLQRINSFHAEERLPAGERAELHDYSRSGWDRGHMSPNGDMPNREAAEQSFSLANMVPQAPILNRVEWEGIESAVRDLAVNDGDIYVITGPAYVGAKLSRIGNVTVPPYLYKAVYNPHTGGAAAYFAENVNTQQYSVLSLEQLQRYTGLDLFPGLPAAVKRTAMALPTPTPHGQGGKRHTSRRTHLSRLF